MLLIKYVLEFSVIMTICFELLENFYLIIYKKFLKSKIFFYLTKNLDLDLNMSKIHIVFQTIWCNVCIYYLQLYTYNQINLVGDFFRGCFVQGALFLLPLYSCLIPIKILYIGIISSRIEIISIRKLIENFSIDNIIIRGCKRIILSC